MLGVVISPLHFGGDLFCYSHFFYIDYQEESNLLTIPRYI